MFTTAVPTARDRHLTPEHEEIVKATLPAVGANIGTIAQTFYRTMFGNHPELLANTFNRGNQKSGEQQKALAASVATFATMLVDPNAPDPVDLLTRIGHKHVSLGITADQYQIVHDNLFAAIAEVLGTDVVTEEVAAAWGEVYWIMADVLITFEEALYESDGVTPGDVFRDVVVVDKQELTDTVTTYTLEGDLSTPRPGQYTSIGVVLADGARQLRQYSIIGQAPGRYTIAVETEGEVSTHLRENVQVGDTIQATLAAGDLVLEEGDDPVVLVSSGIGSTPMVGMLSYLARTGSGRRATYLHADDSEAAHAQLGQTTALLERLPEVTAAHSYRSNGELIRMAEHDLAGSDVYLCGGTEFLQAIRRDLEALPEDKAPKSVRFELFSPNDWLLG
ncbi:MAG: globin domain-containing protein [Corynebacterium sp.]|uniref:globin domain-containing protein n=1 Tax=Corynebacterium sp. TaxID=1720 RepID=UPI0026DF64BE|nr:globin domain-containing protein [Corynebacterium sp.]MDO5670459.1 globin domain-containing protein [Corynebacterium sp.]